MDCKLQVSPEPLTAESSSSSNLSSPLPPQTSLLATSSKYGYCVIGAPSDGGSQEAGRGEGRGPGEDSKQPLFTYPNDDPSLTRFLHSPNPGYREFNDKIRQKLCYSSFEIGWGGRLTTTAASSGPCCSQTFTLDFPSNLSRQPRQYPHRHLGWFSALVQGASSLETRTATRPRARGNNSQH